MEYAITHGPTDARAISMIRVAVLTLVTNMRELLSLGPRPARNSNRDVSPAASYCFFRHGASQAWADWSKQKAPRLLLRQPRGSIVRNGVALQRLSREHIMKWSQFAVVALVL